MATIKVKSHIRKIKGRRIRVKSYSRGQSWSQRSRKSRRNDLKRVANNRPAKVWRPGISHQGDY